MQVPQEMLWTAMSFRGIDETLKTQLQEHTWYDRHMHQTLLSFKLQLQRQLDRQDTLLYTQLQRQTRNNTYTAPGADMVGQSAAVHFSHTLPYKRSTWLKNAKAKGKKKL